MIYLFGKENRGGFDNSWHGGWTLIFKHFKAYTVTIDEAFIKVEVISKSSFMSLVISLTRPLHYD